MQHTALQQFRDIGKLNSEADLYWRQTCNAVKYHHTVQSLTSTVYCQFKIVMICDQDRVFFCSEPLHDPLSFITLVAKLLH
jgi:hypothetical protein